MRAPPSPLPTKAWDPFSGFPIDPVHLPPAAGRGTAQPGPDLHPLLPFSPIFSHFAEFRGLSATDLLGEEPPTVRSCPHPRQLLAMEGGGCPQNPPARSRDKSGTPDTLAGAQQNALLLLQSLRLEQSFEANLQNPPYFLKGGRKAPSHPPRGASRALPGSFPSSFLFISIYSLLLGALRHFLKFFPSLPIPCETDSEGETQTRGGTLLIATPPACRDSGRCRCRAAGPLPPDPQQPKP